MSQFIEMFGDPIKNSKNLPSLKGEELFVFSSGKANTKANLSKEFPYDCYGGNGITGKSEQWLIDFPTIIVGRVGEYCGCVHKTQGKIWITDNAIFIKEYKEKVFNGEFLFYLMTYLDFHRLADETGQPKITQRPLLSTEYMVPNLSLQEQFVSIAHQADKSGFDGCKSQFIEMFGINEPTKPLTDFIEVSFPGEWGQEDKDGSGVKVIRTTNFTNNGKLDLSDVVTRDIDSVKVEKKKLSKGDIILERSGGTNENPVGRVVYFEEDGVYLFNNFTQLLRCKEGVNSLFIFYSLFNYYQMNKNVIRSMGNKTTGIQNLKMDRYWQIPIADVSIERQKEFESIYRQADKSGSGTMFRLAS